MKSPAPGARTTTSRSATTSSPSRSTSPCIRSTAARACMKHGYGVLFGTAANSSVTMVGNLMAHIVERNPLSRAAEFVFVNNLVYDRGTMDVDLQSEQDGVITKNSVVGNVFLRGPSFSARHARRSSCAPRGSLTLVSGSRVYMYDNTPRNRQLILGTDLAHGRQRAVAGLMQTMTITGLEHRARGASHRQQRGLQPRAQVRRCASYGSRHRRQAHRLEREEPQWPGHQLRGARMAPLAATRMPAAGRRLHRTGAR